MKTVTSPPSFRVTYAWDAVGQRSVMTAPTGGRFSYQYDAAGRFSRLINPEGDRTTYAYDVDSRRTVKRLANGTRASFSYDAASNLTTLANMFPDATYISKYDYKYDPTGNRYAVAEADGSRVTWLYDNLYQLIGENRTGTTPFRNTFTYDPLGNRLTKTESGARTTYTYDAANQLRYGQDTTGRTTYTFDAAGNQAKEKSPAGAITTTTWNYENRTTTVTSPTGDPTILSYRPDFLKATETRASSVQHTLWDGMRYLGESSDGVSCDTVLTTEPTDFGRLISKKTATICEYFHFDVMGTPTYTSNESAVRQNALWCGAFGTQVLGNPVGLRSWNSEHGYYQSSSGLAVYVRNRFYLPGLGRWSSRDPLSTVMLPQLYDYGKNSVLWATDPSGLTFYCKEVIDSYISEILKDALDLGKLVKEPLEAIINLLPKPEPKPGSDPKPDGRLHELLNIKTRLRATIGKCSIKDPRLVEVGLQEATIKAGFKIGDFSLKTNVTIKFAFRLEADEEEVKLCDDDCGQCIFCIQKARQLKRMKRIEQRFGIWASHSVASEGEAIIVGGGATVISDRRIAVLTLRTRCRCDCDEFQWPKEYKLLETKAFDDAPRSKCSESLEECQGAPLPGTNRPGAKPK